MSLRCVLPVQKMAGEHVPPPKVASALVELQRNSIHVSDLPTLTRHFIQRIVLYKTVLVPYYATLEHGNIRYHKHIRAQAGLDRSMRAAFPYRNEVVYFGSGCNVRRAGKGCRGGTPNLQVCGAVCECGLLCVWRCV